LPMSSLDIYWKNLVYMLLSPNEAQYKKCCLDTGISKPSYIPWFLV
jgi:hypothetical protein